MFNFFSTKIQVSCRFCHFSQQPKHRNQFRSARRLHNFRQRGIFTEVSYVQVSNGYISSEGSSAVTCCHMLPSDYQLIMSGHKAALCNVRWENKTGKSCAGEWKIAFH